MTDLRNICNFDFKTLAQKHTLLFYICGMCCVSIVAKRTKLEMGEAGMCIDAWTLEFADNTSGIVSAPGEAELQVAIYQIANDKFCHYFNSMACA